jgi:hypothetical protein
LIPLPTFNEPMVLCSPPLKDLPVVDLPFERLVSCLDVPTIVTVVLGFLALEQKVCNDDPISFGCFATYSPLSLTIGCCLHAGYCHVDTPFFSLGCL